MNTSNQHAAALAIVHEEAGRTSSKADFDLCMRIAKRAHSSDAAQASRDAEFFAGICVALQVLTAQDKGVAWREIVQACDVDKLLQYAAHIESDEWELAGFAKYALAELGREKPAPIAALPFATDAAQAPTGKVVSVSDHVLHGYSAILKILGMEEAGDPVQEVERLKALLDAADMPSPRETEALIERLRHRAENARLAASEIDPDHYTPDDPADIAAGLEGEAAILEAAAAALSARAAPVAPAAEAPTLLGSPAEGHWGEPETPSDGHKLESDIDEEAQPDERALSGNAGGDV